MEWTPKWTIDEVSHRRGEKHKQNQVSESGILIVRGPDSERQSSRRSHTKSEDMNDRSTLWTEAKPASALDEWQMH